MTEQRRIVFLATAWGPRHGGINSFNKDLCASLAQCVEESVEVCCVVPSASTDDIHVAKEARVRLLVTASQTLDSGAIWASLKSSGIMSVDWWVGHDLVTGNTALFLREIAGGKAAIIQHVSYVDYAAYKSGDAAASLAKSDNQATLFKSADEALAVGPLLRDRLSTVLAPRKTAHMLVPGLPHAGARPGSVFSGIVFGRMDAENDRIKQGRLGIAAFAAACKQANESAGAPPLLKKNRPRITVVGIDQEDAAYCAQLQTLAEERGGSACPLLHVLPFTESRDVLLNTLSTASVALMPSWHEGFGLTGWEATGVGVPLIVSNQSGVYQLVKEVAPGLESGCLYGISVGGRLSNRDQQEFQQSDIDAIRDAILDIAADYPASLAKAATLRDLLHNKGFNWANTARSFAQALGFSTATAKPREKAAGGFAPPRPVLEERRRSITPQMNVPESSLLRPEAEIVPFHDLLEEQCEDLITWADDERIEPRSVALRLYTGEGGTGKTRFMIEVCRRLRDRRERVWEAGFVTVGQNLKDDFQALIQAAPRVLAVVDYAETRRKDVLALAQAALNVPAGHRVRIVLLGRGRGDWWNLLRDDAPPTVREFLQSLEGTRGPYKLPRPAASQEGTAYRRECFEAAVKSFAAHLGANGEKISAPQFDSPVFSQLLFIHLAALAALHGKVIEDESELLNAALDRERDYWRRVLVAEGLDRDLLDGFSQAVALITLVGGARTAKDGKELLDLTPRLRHLNPATRDKIFDVLRRLYPLDGGIDSLRPDILGEHHVSVNLDFDDELLDVALNRSARDSWARAALTVLTRIAQHGEARWLTAALDAERHLNDQAERAATVAVQVGDPLGTVLAQSLRSAPKRIWVGLVNRIQDKLPLSSVALSEFKEVVSLKRIEYLVPRPAGNPEDASRLAYAYSSASLAVKQNGKLDDALTYAIHAEKIYCSLARVRPDRFRGPWATSLGNLANCLGDNCRFEEALAAAQGAERIRREQASSNPERFQADWATAQGTLALYLSENGRHEEALSFAEQAEKTLRGLALVRPEAYRADWAISLGNLANHLGDNGRLLEGLQFAERAEEIRRALAAARPDTYRADWAAALDNLASHLSDNSRHQEALTFARQAEEIRRSLAAARPEVYRGDWGISLGNMANHLSRNGFIEEALTCSKKAEAIFRGLAEGRPEVYRRDWARSLANLAAHLGDNGMVEEALELSLKAEDIRRSLAAEKAYYQDEWAMSLENLASHLRANGEFEKALSAAEQAEEIYRRLAEMRPNVYRGRWGETLVNLSINLADVGKWNDALTLAESAERTIRELSDERPDIYRPDLAAALAVLAECLKHQGRIKEALGYCELAEGILAQLAALHPEVHRPAWAGVLAELGACLAKAGRYDEAINKAEQSLTMLRDLAAHRPEVYNGTLATRLCNVAARLSELGRTNDAVQHASSGEQILRALCSVRPRVFRPKWAAALVDLALHLLRDGKHNLALAAAQQGHELICSLASEHPNLWKAEVAVSLMNLSAALKQGGEIEAAVRAEREATAVWEAIELDEPGARNRTGEFLLG